MGKKYIQGKDGKFQGSVSDGKAVPVAAPKLPLLHRESSEIDPDAQARMAAAILRRREALNKASAESAAPLLDEVTVDPNDPNSTYYGSSKTDAIQGILDRENGAYIATVVSNFDRASEYLEEKFFTDRAEAERWLKTELIERLQPVQDFQWNWHNNRVQFLDSLEEHPFRDHVEEDLHISLGYPRAELVSILHTASVARYDEGRYSVRVSKFSDDEDSETDYLVHTAQTFEEALNFARYFLVSKL